MRLRGSMNLDSITRVRKKTALPFKRIRSGHSLERNDCTVTALAAATPLTYDEAHAVCKEAGRRDRHGFHFTAWMEHEATKHSINGITFTKTYCWSGLGCNDWIGSLSYIRAKERTVGQFLKTNPQGNYIVIVRNHAFAVIDGVIHDRFCKGQRCIIQKIYKVGLV